MADALAEDLFGDETGQVAVEETKDVPPAVSPAAESTKPAEDQDDDLADDLFGDEEEGEPATEADFIVQDEPGAEGDAQDDEDGDAAAAVGSAPGAEPELDLKPFTVPAVRRPRGQDHASDMQDSDLCLVKLPNFLKIAPEAYDPTALAHEIEAEIEAGNLTSNEQIRRKTFRVDNTVRWKEPDEEEATARMSNARFVRWSDGSLSLQIGTEMFDCPIKAIPTEHNYLTLMHPDEGLLRLVGKFTQNLRILPSGLASKSHTDLKADIARRQQSNKNRGIKEFATSADPEALSRNAAKAEADRIKARRRLETQKQRALNRVGDGRSSRLTAAMLDDQSDEDELGMGAASHRRERDRYDDDDGFIENDEDEEAEEEAGAERLQALKSKGAEQYAQRKRKASEEEEDLLSSEEEAQMTDKDEPPPQVEEQAKKKARRLIFDSDDED